MSTYVMAIVSAISWPFLGCMFIKERLEGWATPKLRRIPLYIKPNYLSYARILISMPVNYFIFWNNIPALWIFFYAVGCATDFIDGALARTRGQCTVFGERLDAFADKVLNGSLIACYLFFIPIESVYLKTLLITILAIDGITTLGGLILVLVKNVCAPASRFGKLKFGFQCAGITLLFINCSDLAFASLIIALVLGGFSAKGYLKECLYEA